jgi:hypothetical protein
MNKKQGKQNKKAVESLEIADQNLNPNVSKSDKKSSKSKDGGAGSPRIPDLNRFQQFLDTLTAKILITAVSMFFLFKTTILITYLTQKLKNSSPSVQPVSERETKAPEPPVEEVDETSDWEIYKNEDYGFETRYHLESSPSERVGDETAGQFNYLLLVEFGTVPIKSLHGYELRVSKQQSLDDYRLELVGHITDAIDSEEEIIVNGNTWTKINYKIFLTTDYVPITLTVTSHSGYSYAITSSKEDVDQILSTFKFLDQEVKGVATEASESCLERETELLEEISGCEIIDEHRCLYIRQEFDSCLLACERDLENQMCLDICKPVCDSL